MLKMLNKYKFLFIILFILFVFTLVITTVRIDYVAYIPGSTDKVGKVVEIEGDEKSDNYYSTSVYYLDRITIFQKFFFKNIKDGAVYKRPKNMTSKIDALRGEIEHNSAIYTSIISAYKKAEVPLDYTFVGMYVYDTTSSVLSIGDVVLGSCYEECCNNLNSGEFEILTNNKKETVKLNDGDKVRLEYPYYEIKDDKIKVYSSNDGGPSAGLMQALKLYDDLVEEDFATNYKVAGTGTIDDNGNVGAIGCIGIKLYTAVYNKCDIFFIPEENRKEAEVTIKKLKTNMKIVFVNTLDDAVDYLRSV